jgi:hypothetical protein
MHIYIDESGTFAIPRRNNGPAIACCGALAIPSDYRDEIFAGFKKLSLNWPKDNGELKGRLLNESHFKEAINFFSDSGLLLNAVAIDMSQQEEGDIKKHRDKTINNLSAKFPINYNAKQKAAVDLYASRIGEVSDQLYTQMMLMIEVVWNAFVANFRWISLADPSDLAVISWTIDRKDVKPTEMELLWHALILPWLTARGVNNPPQFAPTSNFDYLPKDVLRTADKLPPVLARHRPDPNEVTDTLNIEHIFAGIEFDSSKTSEGLQMVDVAISAVRRAMTGTLQRSGWERLGSIILHPGEETEVIPLVNLTADRATEATQEYEKVLTQLRSEVLPSVPPTSNFVWRCNRTPARHAL